MSTNGIVTQKIVSIVEYQQRFMPTLFTLADVRNAGRMRVKVDTVV